MRGRVNPKKINSKLKDLPLMKEVATAWSKESMEAKGKPSQCKERKRERVAHKWEKRFKDNKRPVGNINKTNRRQNLKGSQSILLLLKISLLINI